MIKIEKIIEAEGIRDYLISRNLIKQYKKSKISILAGIIGGTDFKNREPKEKGIWSFRINKQFRALCKIDGNILIVIKVYNHQ